MPREMKETNVWRQFIAMKQTDVVLPRFGRADGNSHMFDFGERMLRSGENSIHDWLTDQSSPVKSPGSISPRR